MQDSTFGSIPETRPPPPLQVEPAKPACQRLVRPVKDTFCWPEGGGGLLYCYGFEYDEFPIRSMEYFVN